MAKRQRQNQAIPQVSSPILSREVVIIRRPSKRRDVEDPNFGKAHGETKFTATDKQRESLGQGFTQNKV